MEALRVHEKTQLVKSVVSSPAHQDDAHQGIDIIKIQQIIIHSKLCSTIPVATKVHMILWSFVALTWMRDTIE